MRTGRRTWQWGVGLILIGIAAVMPLFLWGERPLLARATSTGLIVCRPYYWLSGQEILILGYTGGGFGGAHPMRYHIASKTTTDLPLLKDLLATFPSDSKTIRIAPGGDRLLCSTNRAETYVARIDGTEFHEWRTSLPQSGFEWDPAGRYWLSFLGSYSASAAGFYSPDIQKCSQVLVHDTAGPFQRCQWWIGKKKRPVALHIVEDRKSHQSDTSTQSWPLSAQSPLGAGQCDLSQARLLTRKRLLAVSAPPQSTVLMGKPPLPAETYEMNLRSQGTLARRLPAFRSPGATVEEWVFSPHGDRQAWLVVNPRVWTGPSWLLRLWRLFAPPQSPQYEVWVSGLQGTERHEVGRVSIAQLPPSRPMNRSGTLISGLILPVTVSPGEVHDLRWLPDGKRLSFIYHRLLYTVPPD